MVKLPKFAFFGTPDIAVKTLEILKQSGYVPSLIVTSPDKPKGRKLAITPPPVKLWATTNKIPFIQPETLDDNLRRELSAVGCELFVVVAYGKIFPEWLINLPKYGTINIHYSLLPKYRGASPVQAAILNGERETGVTVQKMVKILDAGPIIAQEKTVIKETEKAPDLLERLADIGGNLLARILPDYLSGRMELAEQDPGLISFCPKIQKIDGLIRLEDDPVKNYNKFRAFYGWPRTYFMENGKRVIVIDAILKGDKFIVNRVLPEGKKETSFEEFQKRK
jgi:methionyl-tRNA formyltransferase